MPECALGPYLLSLGALGPKSISWLATGKTGSNGRGALQLEQLCLKSMRQEM